jgi:hypothetical protein
MFMFLFLNFVRPQPTNAVSNVPSLPRERLLGRDIAAGSGTGSG